LFYFYFEENIAVNYNYLAVIILLLNSVKLLLDVILFQKGAIVFSIVSKQNTKLGVDRSSGNRSKPIVQGLLLIDNKSLS